MNTKEAIKASMDVSLMVLNTYVSDLSDSELLVRPGPGCNHLAWQLGHLISSEVGLLKMISSAPGASLPAGFAEKHSKENAQSDNPADFCSKQTYLDLYQQVRQASLAALDQMSDQDLDQPAPENFRSMFPNVGYMFTLIATHPLMHAGQYVVVRRQLGKPVLI
jgi:uncharacterized damage-inducible protein DinB